MTNQVKVPKEIQELFFEAAAFKQLAANNSRWLIPSPKAFYWAIRGEKVSALAWRTLQQLSPTVNMSGWAYDAVTGLATAPVAETPKAPRVPRKAKVKAEQPAKDPV